MNFRKFKKNAKALSPVIASIILIAVTVAVSVVVAAWMGGLTLGFMSNAEQAQITTVSFNSVTVATLTVQNTGSNAVTILTTGTIDGTSYTVTTTAGTPASFVVAKSGTSTFNITATGGTGNVFVDGSQYVFTLQTAKGHTLTYTATYNVQPSL
jgi:flagellin-like protein